MKHNPMRAGFSLLSPPHRQWCPVHSQALKYLCLNERILKPSWKIHLWFPLFHLSLPMRIMPSETQRIHIVQVIFVFLLGTISQRAFHISVCRSALFFFIPARSSTGVPLGRSTLTGLITLLSKKAFLVSGIVNKPIELMMNRIASTWAYASGIVLSTL